MAAHAILLPMLVLAGWTMVVWAWMYATRLPAMARAGIDGARMIGSTGKGLRDQLVAAGEERACWVADNYNHLLEQPVLFCAVVLAIAVSGMDGGMNPPLAWAYVGLRIAHSLVQVTTNRVAIRFALFALASIMLMMLIANAVLALL